MHDKCLNCGSSLDAAPRADNPGARAQMKWCSAKCKQHYKNRAYYALHRDEVKARIAANKRAMQDAATPIKGKLVAQRDDAGFVYVVKCAGYYKIGATRNATQRIARFETSYPHDLKVHRVAHVQNMSLVESSLHTRFADKRVKGEWFNLDSNDLRVIARLLPNALTMNPSTQRPRRIELEKLGLVLRTAQTRKTTSGRDAVVFVAAEAQS